MYSKRLNSPFILFFLLLLSLSFFVSPVAMGSETGHSTTQEVTHGEEASGDHGADRSRDLLDLLYRFINFALLVIILAIVIRKTTIKDIFKNRTNEIRDRLESLKREKEEAEARYKDMESQLKDFESKKKEIIDQFINEGLAEKERIISEAKERVDQIIKQSEMTIDQEILSARNRLKEEVVDMAALKAREIISGKIDERDQDKLIDEFIERMGKLH